MRYHYRGPKSIVNNHVAEEQIHGLVEAAAPEDQHYQADVRHHDEDVNKEEEDKGWNEEGDL